MSEFKNSFSCSRCKKEKDVSEFHKGNGLTGPRSKVASYCKQCMSEYGKETSYKYRQSRVEYRAKVKHYPEVKLKQLLRVSHVDRTALDYDWCWKRLCDNNFRCEITGKKFTWGSKEPTSLSIDRIDTNKGYTKDNIRFVCWWVNAAMGTWGLETLRELTREWQDNE